MRIATWNINSLRARMDRVLDFLQRHEVDVLALQEIKAKPEQLDLTAFEAAGYEVATHGLNQWNGVALFSRVGLADVRTELPDVPSFPEDGTGVVEARALSGVVGDGLRIWSLYVPDGREIDHPHYAYKLRWLETLRAEGARELAADADAQGAPWWATSTWPRWTRMCQGSGSSSRGRPTSPSPSGPPSVPWSTPASPM